MGAAWLFPGWAALLEPTLQALKELGVPARAAPLTSMHFSIDCLCLTELQLETLLWEASGGQAVSSAPLHSPIPRPGRRASLSSPIRKVTALDGRTLRPHPALICGKPWPPQPHAQPGIPDGTAKLCPGPRRPPGLCSVDCPWRTLGQQRSLLCNLQASEDQAERRRLQGAGAVCRPQLPGSLYLQGPPACLTSRLSLGLSVFEGPPPGPPCHSEGPPGPASGSELCGGCTGKGTPPSKTC